MPLRIAVIDLVRGPCRGPVGRLDSWWTKRGYAGLMPQAVSAWCRRGGHHVRYDVYRGGGDLSGLVAPPLDVVFVSAHTPLAPLAPLAIAVARLARRAGARTVIGGPHARAFPAECARAFDHTVLECDAALIADILAGRFPPHSIVTAAAPPDELPSVEERLPELRAMGNGRPVLVPMLASTGCPYDCDFCVDAVNPYRPRDAARLAEDVRFAATRLPGVPLFFHDPNFGVRFDEHVGVLAEVAASVAPSRAAPYIVETSLANLRGDRPARLAATGCRLVASGIEAWRGYAGKADAAGRSGADKLEAVARRYDALRPHVPFGQATFILGLDGQDAAEEAALGAAFAARVPWVWPYFNIPVAYGGTALRSRLAAEGRLLNVPFPFWKNPWLTVRLVDEPPDAVIDRFADLVERSAAPGLLARRVAAAPTAAARAEHVARSLFARPQAAGARAYARALRDDAALRAYHLGDSDALPSFYRDRWSAVLGRYAELVTLDDALPGGDAVVAPLVGSRAAA